MIDPEVLLQGYRLGVFPMAMADGAIEWFSPDPRAILPLKEFHVSHTLERTVRKKAFEIRFDISFTEVMRECARRPETWINEEIIASYTRLHQLGYAHSIESWKNGKLAGGLYGVPPQLIVRHQAGNVVAQSHDAGPGQRRHVDDLVGLLARYGASALSRSTTDGRLAEVTITANEHRLPDCLAGKDSARNANIRVRLFNGP